MNRSNINNVWSLVSQEFEGVDCLYSYQFIGRVLTAVNDNVGFVLELSHNGKNKPVWFCWRLFEKDMPDRDSIKWIVYKPDILRDWK